MYILMYVATMLMLLVMMTYGRLESFRGFAYIQSEFKQYMEKHEREFINNRAILQYKDTVAKSTDPSDDEQDKSPARSLLMFNLFIDKAERDAHPIEYDQLTQITRHLIIYLYGEQPFFKKMEDKRPNFISELLEAISVKTEALKKGKKIKKIGELSTIEFDDPDMNEAFAHMLKGSYEQAQKVPLADNVVGTDQVVRPNFLPREGYYPLLNFVTLDKGNYKIRVYLASPQLLMVIFGNADTVYNILQERYNLYKAVKRGMDKGEASTSFKNQFLNQRSSYVLPETLDFGVSKTNPRDYE